MLVCLWLFWLFRFCPRVGFVTLVVSLFLKIVVFMFRFDFDVGYLRFVWCFIAVHFGFAVCFGFRLGCFAVSGVLRVLVLICCLIVWVLFMGLYFTVSLVVLFVSWFACCFLLHCLIGGFALSLFTCSIVLV